MVKEFTVTRVENGYTIEVVYADEVIEKHIATTDAKLKKLIKAILTVKVNNDAN